MRPAATQRPQRKTAAREVLLCLWRLRGQTNGTGSTTVVAAAIAEQPSELGDLLQPHPAASNSLSSGVGSPCVHVEISIKAFTIDL